MSADRPAERSGTRRGLAGRVLGDRYRVVRMVSAGANTLIADAEDIELDRPVTVKLVRPEWAESAEFRKRFAAQMRGMSSLSHPNIATVHDWGEEQVGKRTTVYAVVEYLSGGSLRDLFDRGRHLDPSQALVVGLEACRGLDFAHRKGLVHTELTPAKMVFGDDRRLRIVDFALARLLGEHDWAEPATVATHVARYSSPEQALAQPIDGKTDVYSLALILVEAVSGTVPFAARSTVATLSARIGRLMPVSADLGPLAAVLERAGRPEPADRSTAGELGRALVGAAEKLPRPTPIPLLVTGMFDDEQMRRPNDPTGGIARPAPDDEAIALVPMSGRPLDDDVTTADVAASPEEAAAVATTAAALAAPSTGTPPVPTQEPAVPIVEPLPPPAPAGSEPRLYDGDVDRTIDELAELARPAPAPLPDIAPIDDGLGASPPAVVAADTARPVASSGDDRDGDGGGRRRRRWLAWLVGLLVVGALAALGYLAFTLFRVPTHEVPVLVGLDEAAARAQTADFDWDLDIEVARSDEQPEVGRIIRTAPSAGEQLGEGEPFLVVISEGPEFRTLPDLAGLPLSEAETSIAELQLAVLPATEQFDENVPAGSVVAWSVPSDPTIGAGGQVLPDTAVAIVVSSGPAPRTVPSLGGLSVADATAQLEAIQLVTAVAEAVFSDDIPTGNVISATPEAEAQVERGSTVTLVPSKGVDLVVMPDLTGQTLDQARATLAASGLTVGSLLGSTQGIFVSATVAGDPADPGEQFRRNTSIDMIYL